MSKAISIFYMINNFKISPFIKATEDRIINKKKKMLYKVYQVFFDEFKKVFLLGIIGTIFIVHFILGSGKFAKFYSW